MDVEHLLLILIITLVPAGLMLFGIHLIIKRFFERDHAKQVKEVMEISKKKILPLRLQAVERFVLYLERINPVSSILVAYRPGMSAALLQSDLVKQVRTEFDHNIAQQVYISDEAWKAVKNSKEETIKLINIAAQQLGPNANGIDLSNKIYELMAEFKEAPTDIATRMVKREVRKLF